MAAPDSIIIDEVKCVRKDSTAAAVKWNGLPYVICRTQSAGVFAGYLQDRKGQEVTLYKARRLWYWKGAASLSQAAEEGFSAESECKFPCEVERLILLQAIEVLDCTKKAQESIKRVKTWKA